MKRATKNQKIMTGSYNISIHALMKRATTDLPNIALYPEYFNPRPHEEGDTLTVTGVAIADISIHALMKRATS